MLASLREKDARRSSGGSLKRGESGSAALEFALSIPFLALLLVAAIEIGMAAYQSMQVQNAAEAGAVYVSKHGMDAAGIASAVQNSTGAAGITATPPPAQFCGCPSASGVAAIACDATCPGGGAPGYYVRVSARLTRQPVLSIAGLAAPTTMTGESVIRIY